MKLGCLRSTVGFFLEASLGHLCPSTLRGWSHLDAATEAQNAMDNRYEGGNWWYENGYYYLFASSTNCCNGPAQRIWRFRWPRHTQWDRISTDKHSP